MKKKLEADLISIAHRILKLKSKEDLKLMHAEARLVYEKLTVLLFVEENFSDIKPTIGLQDTEAIIANAFENDAKTVQSIDFVNNDVAAVDKVIEEEIFLSSEIIEKESSQENEAISPIFEINNLEDEQVEITEPSVADSKPTIDDNFLNIAPTDLIFERVQNTNKDKEATIIDKKEIVNEIKVSKEDNNATTYADNSTNLNEKLNKNLNLSLNDKLAFEQELFDFSKEDFNRVINQIATFENFEEAKNFINEMVKPDYNNWVNKDEFVTRFMTFVESKFI